MKRLFRVLLNIGASRAVTPVVIGIFFLIYVGIAFFTDEALITLIAFTSHSLALSALLSLIPLNNALRLAFAVAEYLQMRRAASGRSSDGLEERFDEAVQLPASAALSELESRLAAEGYRVRTLAGVLSAGRGMGNLPCRIVFLAATFCFFAGVLVSITSRTSLRQMVVEGEPMLTPKGAGGIVERITLAEGTGSILSKTLTMEVAPNDSSGHKFFGLYPPSLYGGAFVYPRYLGLAADLRFSAPDLQPGYETHCPLNTYPPGKEDNVAIPGSAYRVVFSIAEPDAGIDRYISYMTGKVTFQFKLLKDKEVLFTGTVPGGGEFVRDGYRLALPEVRRLVVTDFIRDYGVLFIWWSGVLLLASICLWLPVRLFFPRREMLFFFAADGTRAFSLAEGREMRHAGVFHDALDLVNARPVD